MATGSGKTYTAVSSICRLIKFGGVKRVVFLVDRAELGKQALNEFQQYVTPDDGRKFTEIYNVQRLQSDRIDPVANVCITTIQRLYSMLCGEEELDPALEEQSQFELDAALLSQPPKEVRYNPSIPIETFDVIVRSDFSASTSNKQLNFVQHIKTLLKINGRAAVVVPDNVLFEGGAGETVRRKLLQECDVHTLLRLPTGIFYAQGVKANVLFFDKKPASPNAWTERLWVYDLRTNQNFTLRTNPLTRRHLDDFVTCYHAENRHQRQESDRFHSFGYDELLKRDKLSLDLFWLKDSSLEGSDTLPSPKELAASIVEDLQAALEQFAAIEEDLSSGVGIGEL